MGLAIVDEKEGRLTGKRPCGAEIGSRPSGGGRERVTDGLPLPPNELHGKGDVGEDEVERRLQVLAV